MSFKEGNTVIVTRGGVNHVAVVLGKRVINRIPVYDVLLENRSAFVMVPTSSNSNTYINCLLTEKLCDTDQIETTIPYKELVANEQIPHLDAYFAGKASW